jgi:GR25 family glycosyltransferase involved in LPS biosynthesis/predicted O-methyltransferase YrrM
MKTYILHINEELSIEYAEDCRNSCKEFGIEAELFLGIRGATNRELTRKTGYNIRTFEYSSEYCATVGHINIWKKIAESGETGVVLEHDVVVKGDYTKLVVNDGEILFLGPRLYNRNDYQFPANETVDYHNIDFYNGAHAYIITANTAKAMVDYVEQIKMIEMPVDGLLGLKNKFNLVMKAVDPVFALAEIGDRNSFNFDKPDDTNRYYFEKFLANIDPAKLPPVQERIFTVDWFSGNIPHWEETLKLVGKDASQELHLLEIGAYEGKSTCWFSDNIIRNVHSRMDVVDTFEGSIEHSEEKKQSLQKKYFHNLGLTRNGEKIHTYVGDSRVYLPFFLRDGKKYDIIYVDGAHMPENVIIDGLCAFHLLKEDGVIVFDDYEWNFDGKQTVKIGLDRLETMVPIKPILTGWQRSYIISK